MKKLVLSILFYLCFCAAAQADLVGYWNLDEGQGTVVHDSSGNGNDGSFQTGSTAWVSGKNGNALQFYGAPADSVYMPNSSSFNFSNAFTIMAWVKPDNTLPLNVVLSKYNPGDPVTFLLRQNQFDNGKWEVTLDTNNGTTHAIVLSNSPIQAGIWQHLAATYDGGKLRLYVNGFFENSVPTAGSWYLGNEPILIGGQTQGVGETNPFKGVIDDVRVYNNALSQNQIKAVMTPEPASMILFGIGAAAMAAYKRRKKTA